MFPRFYTILAPRVLRPNSEYHVAITTQKTSQPTIVTVGVGGNQHGGGTFQATETVTVSPYTTQIVKLEVRENLWIENSEPEHRPEGRSGFCLAPANFWKCHSNKSGLENRKYGRRDPSRWPRDSLYPQKLALTSPTSGSRSSGIVRSLTEATEFITN
jgi:hypothetical protein